MIDDQPRHLSRSALSEYLLLRAPAIIKVAGDPKCQVVIDPTHSEISLQTPVDSPSLEGSKFENLACRVVSNEGKIWQEIALDYGDRPHEAYLLLTNVIDMVQQDGLKLSLALRLAMRTFQELVALKSVLSRERQLGLFGELLFLEHYLKHYPGKATVAAWKGSVQGEHDFVFPYDCYEVKTTTQEKRVHQISSLEQLEPLPSVPLWLISIQLTCSVEDSGRSLPMVVNDVRRLAEQNREILDGSLEVAGWKDANASMYADLYSLRSVPAAYLVNTAFPSLTRAQISKACARPELFVGARYQLDLTALPTQYPPGLAMEFVKDREGS